MWGEKSSHFKNSVFFLSQMNPDSRPSFTEVVAELEKIVSDREKSECMEPDAQGESAKTI